MHISTFAYLSSSSLSISMFFLFIALPGADLSSLESWARRIFWKSSWVKSLLVLTAAALDFCSSTGMLLMFSACYQRHIGGPSGPLHNHLVELTCMLLSYRTRPFSFLQTTKGHETYIYTRGWFLSASIHEYACVLVQTGCNNIVDLEVFIHIVCKSKQLNYCISL